ncbi:MAG: hypothetical protein LBH98_03420 [Chitinispirillales bacterium]|jgi:hypothetical protein|nr:hypothetical protein [Chitinispirillales bacterium]
MRKIFLILFLFLFSCGKKNIDVLPEKKYKENYDNYNSEVDISSVLSSEFQESEIKLPIDSSAVLNIITQIPFESVSLVDTDDACEFQIQQISLKSAAIRVYCEKSSIQTAGDLSDFARNSPASLRGIFGDLVGISDVANGTQKVVSGIIPKSFNTIEYRFEMPIVNLSDILPNLVLRYNKFYEISQNENKILMNRRENSLGACQTISVENIGNNDPIITLGAKRNMTAMLFRKSDINLLKLKLPNFNIIKFDELSVCAVINPSLDFEVKSAINSILQNKNEYKKLDYDISLISNGSGRDFTSFNKDSIVIIYDKNNPMAYETAVVSAKILREKTGKKVIVTGDLGQKKLYYFDYDVAISVNPKNSDYRFLSRKFFAKELTQVEMTDLKYKIDLFYVDIYLCSQQKINSQGGVSKLEVIKNDSFGY